MKKLILTFVLLAVLAGIDKAIAQNGRNNNSDFKVPLPVVAPPSSPNYGFNIAIPAMPFITVPAATIPSLTAANFLPQIPSAPSMPMAPDANMLQSLYVKTIESIYPKTIKLPPLPFIPPNPQVRLALY